MKNTFKLPSPLVGSDRYFLSEHQPLEFTKGKGFEVFDQHGTSYIDFICGLGPVILGHADEEFNSKLGSALGNGLSFPGFGAVHQQLAESFESAQSNKRVVSLFKTSSEAVTAAIRCAMMATTRKQILRCGFLGWHDAQIFSTPSWHEQPGSSKREALRFINGYRGVLNEESVHNWVDLDLTSLSNLLSLYGNNIAVFVIDVYQLAFMDKSILTEAILQCRKYGIQIIFDETKTAGRTNPVGYLHNFYQQPDYYVLGKAIANGMPLSVLLGNEENISIYREARIGGTHTKDVLSAVASQITFDIMKEKNGYERICLTGQRICQAFNQAAEAASVSMQVKAQMLFDGALFDLWYDNRLLNNFKRRSQLKDSLFRNKLLLLDGHCSFVNLAHEKMNFEKLADLFYASLADWNQEA